MTRTSVAPALLRYAAVPVGLLGSALLVMHTSNAAFTATTENPTHNWAAGSVELVDNDADTALFNVSGLTPTDTDSRCIVVTYNGDVASTVKLYGTDYAQTNGLGENLDLVISEGTGAAADCSDFSGSVIFTDTLDAFGTTVLSHGTGVGTFAPSTPATTRTYRVTYTLNANAPDTVQGGTAAVGLTWEAQSS